MRQLRWRAVVQHFSVVRRRDGVRLALVISEHPDDDEVQLGAVASPGDDVKCDCTEIPAPHTQKAAPAVAGPPSGTE